MNTKENKILTPDRHMRLLAMRWMRQLQPINDALANLKLEPSILGKKGFIFDQALVLLQCFLDVPESAQPATHFANLNALRAFGVPNHVFGNAISWLSNQYQRFEESQISLEEAQTYQIAEQTFSTVAQYISSGEWSYVFDIKDTSKVASALMIEGWGTFLEKLTKIDGIRPTFVRAIEEILGTKFPDSEIWQDVKPWVIEEAKLFAPEFIDFIQG